MCRTLKASAHTLAIPATRAEVIRGRRVLDQPEGGDVVEASLGLSALRGHLHEKMADETVPTVSLCPDLLPGDLQEVDHPRTPLRHPDVMVT